MLRAPLGVVRYLHLAQVQATVVMSVAGPFL